MVEEYKYLSVHLDNRLDWRLISEAIYKKSQSRLYFLRKLGSFNKCVVEITCWGSSIRARDLKRLKNLMKNTASVLLWNQWR